MTAAPLMAHLTSVLVALPPGDNPPQGHGPEWGKAAPIGLLVWLFMGLALFFLIKSMNKHLRKVPRSFDGDAAAAGSASAAGAEGAEGSVTDDGEDTGDGNSGDGDSGDDPPGERADSSDPGDGGDGVAADQVHPGARG